MYCLLIQKWLFPSWTNPLILIATWLSMFISCFDFSLLTTTELRLCVIHINLATFKRDTVTTYVSGHCFALHLWLWISRSFSTCDISKTADKRVHLDLLPSLSWISVSGGERWWFLPTLVPDRQGKKEREGKTAVRDTFCHSNVCQDPLPLHSTRLGQASNSEDITDEDTLFFQSVVFEPLFSVFLLCCLLQTVVLVNIFNSSGWFQRAAAPWNSVEPLQVWLKHKN